MAKYDLTDSLETNFTFAIGDKEFSFRKPTVREMRALAKNFSGISEETDPDKQAEASDTAMGELYKFTTPMGHDSNIKELMDDQPVGVQLAFNEMIQKELGVK